MPRLLLVDDDNRLRRAAARVLEGFFEVTHAANATEAPAQIDRSAVFDVPLTDLEMPGADGIDPPGRAGSRDSSVAPSRRSW
ncbi:MAG: response regulator [Myxococcales bacterium]|nr:response regulator [Myxococcales bacterium]